MNLTTWMRRLRQAVRFDFPETDLSINLGNPNAEAHKLLPLIHEINAIKWINVSLGLVSGIIGLVLAIGAFREIFDQIPGILRGDTAFPVDKLLLPIPFMLVCLVLNFNLKHITGVLLELNRLHHVIVVVNLLNKAGTEMEQRNGMYVMTWRADNGEEFILGTDQVEADAMAKAAKNVIAMTESLDRENFLKYIRLNSDDPREHLKTLLAMHAAQKASREES